jgi:ABC-type glycerol-3-phosphate transport system substrate-binding protein
MRKIIIVVSTVAVLSLSFSLLYSGGQKEGKAKDGGKSFKGVTLNVLMEDVPDTESIEPYLPEFKELTGIDVTFEKVVYTVMHEKLVPQLLAGEGNGAYDFLQVDNYWVGEFVMAGWLRPIDDYLAATPSIKMDDYIDAVVDMFTVGDKTYFIPQWTYPFGLVYRSDIVEDPKFHAFFEKQTGKKWSFPPKDLYGYAEMAVAANKFTPGDVYGCAMQGAKIDPIVMELTNYVYALDGDYYDRNTWKASFDSPEGKAALNVYKDLLRNAAQPGASGANFDDAFNVFGQGKAAFAITHNFLMPWLLDPQNSAVAEVVKFVPLPGGGLLGGWAWAIPVSSPNPDAAWEFIKWVETKKIQKTRGMGGGMPCAKWIYEDEEFLDKYEFQRRAQEVIATAKALPVISQSTRMVEIVGEYSSSAMIGDLTIDEALRRANKELNEIIKDDPLVEMQK